jgi:hypothetical protein
VSTCTVVDKLQISAPWTFDKTLRRFQPKYQTISSRRIDTQTSNLLEAKCCHQHEPEVRESGSECGLKRGRVLRRGTNCLASVQSSQRRLSQNNYIQLKNRLVDFIVANSVGYMVGYKGITRWTPCQTAHYRRWIAQRLVRGGSGRDYSTKPENIAALPRNRRLHGYQTNKHRRHMSGVARVSRRGLESYFRHYSPMEGFIQASHIVKIKPRVNIRPNLEPLAYLQTVPQTGRSIVLRKATQIWDLTIAHQLSCVAEEQIQQSCYFESRCSEISFENHGSREI